MNDLLALANRHELAFGAFLRMDKLEHPAPDAPKWHQGLPLLMIPFGLVAIAGIALSSLRTAPVFQSIATPMVGETLALTEAILAVIVIEVFIVVSRYVHIIIEA